MSKLTLPQENVKNVFREHGFMYCKIGDFMIKYDKGNNFWIVSFARSSKNSIKFQYCTDCANSKMIHYGVVESEEQLNKLIKLNVHHVEIND